MVQNLKQTQKNYIWNTIGSLTYAVISVAFLWVVTLISGQTEAGIFAIGYAVSQQVYVLATFEIRSKQGIDINGDYSYGDYRAVKMAVCFCALLFAIIYLLIKGESPYVFFTCLLITIFYILSAFADLYHGEFQLEDRLYIAGKSLTIRSLLSIAVFSISLWLWNNLVIAAGSIIVISIFWISVFDHIIIHNTLKKEDYKVNKTHLKEIFLICLPLFLSSFFYTLIINGPKFAIDAYDTYEMQSIFNYLLLPASVLNLFGFFIFRPQLTTLARYWQANEMRAFRNAVLKIILVITGFSCFCLMIGYFIGLPVLSLFFHVDLHSYLMEFMILLGGGCFTALIFFLFAVVVVEKRYTSVCITYILIAVAGVILSFILTKQFSLTGAACAYCITMAVLCIGLAILSSHAYYRKTIEIK